MKKSKILMLLVTIILLLSTTCVFAAEALITLEGDNTITSSEIKTISVKVSSEDLVGLVSGKIQGDGNIEITNVTSANNWNLTYNSDTGEFNAYKAEGTNEEEIISIEFTTEETEGNGIITISEIEATTVDYETIQIENVTQDITIGDSEMETPGNTTPGNTTPGNTTPGNTTPGNTTPDNTTPGNTTPGNTTPDNTTAGKEYPKTGAERTILPIVVLIIVLVVSYAGYRKYKEI